MSLNIKKLQNKENYCKDSKVILKSQDDEIDLGNFKSSPVEKENDEQIEGNLERLESL